MGRTESTSTARAKRSTSYATHSAPLMTPPPTPQKPKPKPARKDEAQLQYASTAHNLKGILEGTETKGHVKHKHVRQAARIAEPANNSPSKPTNRKSVTFDAVVVHMDALVQRSASKPTTTLAPLPAHSPTPPSHSAHSIPAAKTETRKYDSTANFDLTPILDSFGSNDFAHPDPVLASAHEFLLGIRAEQSALCAQTDMLERRLKGTLSTAERRRVEKVLELMVALGCELVIEEGGFREVCERRMGDKGWDLEREFHGLRERVGKVVEVFDGRMGNLK
jgi:hypothetical protein